MKLSNYLKTMEYSAPLALAEAWDNVGLLLGDGERVLSKTLLAIDLTPQVLNEAVAKGVELVIAYHPPLFKPISRISADSILFQTARRGIAIYSPHTAWDACIGGTNDVLADAAGILRRAPLTEAAWKTERMLHRLEVTGAQHSAPTPSMSKAQLWPAPDGRQWQSDGQICTQRRFLSLSKDNGAVHQRLDCVGPEQSAIGQGRIGTLEREHPISLTHLAAQMTTRLRLPHAQIACAHKARTTHIRTVAVAAGAGDGLLDQALAQGADVFITGELRHHAILRCLSAGVHVILLSHDGSERFTLTPFCALLNHLVPGVSAEVSQKDISPLQAVIA